MDQTLQLQVKPFVPQKGEKFTTILITDISFHTSHKRQTTAVGTKIKKHFKAKTAGRVYYPIQDFTKYGSKQEIMKMLENDPSFRQLVMDKQSRGEKVIVEIPNDGVPFKLGEDTVKFLNSKNGRRLLKGVAKNLKES